MADIIDLIYEDHDWVRRRFLLLDDAGTDAERAAIWGPLGARLDLHAQAEEVIFYPALLEEGHAGDPRDETDDAIRDHNKIRDAVREARRHRAGTTSWWAAVDRARRENGEHLEEEEREALTDFRRSASLQRRHELAMAWLAFYAEHQVVRGVDDQDKDPDEYIEQNS